MAFKENEWLGFHGPNLGYLHDLYEQYKNDPDSVDPDLKLKFEQLGAPPLYHQKEEEHQDLSDINIKKIIAAVQLVEDIRTYGHLAANIYPIEHENEEQEQAFSLERYDLTEEDLQRIPSNLIWKHAPNTVENGLDAIHLLKDIYTRSIAFEFSHIHNKEEREWLNEMVESESAFIELGNDAKLELAKLLTQVDHFEKFLHKTFVGQKRFSIEGLDTLVPILDEIVKYTCDDGTKNLMVGMAHRGRLNVLAHILKKPYEMIFSEFHQAPNKELVPSEGSMGINYGWTGDVKYHLGANRKLNSDEDECVHIKLANNPSHLEFVNPVVEGYTRASQEDRDQPGYPKQDVSRALNILIHGDAAFPGEGVVAETLNLNRIRGYQTGGTIHIIANNQLGFTTESEDSRSTRYASDIAKGYEIPIIHVNADDPEACVHAAFLAYQYRTKFKGDVIIDLIGYRLHGHNEMDDPNVTQPTLYKKIKEHKNIREKYVNKLMKEGNVSEDQIKSLEKEIQDELQENYKEVKKEDIDEVVENDIPDHIKTGYKQIDTTLKLDTLREINQELLDWPEDFKVYPKLEKILKRREKAFEPDHKIDWALGETLAFATILADSIPIRITGQDVERGTFAHRHLVLHDQDSNKTFSPLHLFPKAKASFAIHNSALSETAILGFEYGYSVEANETLVIWEAQFGDFVNAAQVIIDQFIAAGRAKWNQKSSLVMLLPHAYEGQGPEHSSARPERFLHAAAENNWTIINVTSAAQYYHALRVQALMSKREEARPLIVFTPKSLIRNPLTESDPKELSDGSFKGVVPDPLTEKNTDQVERLLLCSGKVAIDLAQAIQDKEDMDWSSLKIVRVEQLYPFPKDELQEVVQQLPNLKEVIWVQEEPQNMGAWFFIEPRLRILLDKKIEIQYVGRPHRSSPATGDPKVHKREQKKIVNKALGVKEGGE